MSLKHVAQRQLGKASILCSMENLLSSHYCETCNFKQNLTLFPHSKRCYNIHHGDEGNIPETDAELSKTHKKLSGYSILE